jgi:signal transduction histidine kinase
MQPVAYFIPRAKWQPFSTYRLQIDTARPTDLTLDMSVQLAELHLVGPLVNVPDESKVQMVISSSCSNPTRGPAEFAFDDDPATAWSDYGLGSPGGCWLQLAYVPDSKTLVTNLSQASLLTHISAARTGLTDGGARVISNLTAKVVAPRSLTAYALTSANDLPGRDPKSWELLGSNDDGNTWTVVDRRVNEMFTGRFERRVFNLTNAASFIRFRLQIDSCMAVNAGCQLADLEPIYANPQAAAAYTLVVGANADNPPVESAEMAFDDDFRTKWLSFVDASPQDPCWLEWQLTPREDELPVIARQQIDRLARRQRMNQLLDETNAVRVSITGYALTSANDFPDRDPSDWKLLGSNDGGKTWEVLDHRQHEVFAERLQRRAFVLARPAAYRLFRLEIDSAAAPTNAVATQLAELGLVFQDSKMASSLAVLASSQGENSPMETVDHLFDGNAKTKWLDFATGNSNRASWIEWHYAVGSGERAIDLNREQVTHSLLPSRFELRLSASVLFADPAGGMVGLGDQTGFDWVHLDSWPAAVVPGVRMDLSGELQVRNGGLFLSNTLAASVHPLAAAASPGWELAPAAEQSYFSARLAGWISGVFSASSYCGATLTLSNGSSLVVRLPGARFPVPPEVGCPVRIDGVLQYLRAPEGGWVPGVLWAPGPEAITLAPGSEAAWNKMPEYSPDMPLPAAVRLRGVVERTGESGSLFLDVGTNRITAAFLGALPAPVGSPVDAVGWLVTEAGKLKLYHVSLCAGEPVPSGAPPLLTRISAVHELLNQNGAANAQFKLQGVVTYIDLGLGEFYLQDGKDCIRVLGQMNAGLGPKLDEEGNLVEVQGVLHDGVVNATTFVRVLGRGQLPAPVHPSWDHLLSGQDDGRWVEVEGVITETQNDRIALRLAGGELMAWINELDRAAARTLPGNAVRIRGVCAPIVNSRNQRLGMRLLVPSMECVDLLSLTPENPFGLPLLPVNAIMAADSGAQSRYARTRGVVTCRQGRTLFLQDQTYGLRVSLRDDAEAGPGDVVEAVGMPQPDGLSPRLGQAVIRKVGRAPMPAATPIDLAKVTVAGLADDLDATRVELEVVLVNESVEGSRRTLNLRSEKARQIFRAYLPADDPATPPVEMPVGSRLQVQGVLKAIQDRTPDVDQAATSFELYVNSPADITVLARPSWWTTPHMVQVSAVLGGCLAVGLGWIWLLRNRVRQRTRDLAFKIEELKRSELSLAGEVAERKRLQAAADKAHQQLLTVARQAGMAEVATGILHNVGNVLNSVNVSSTLVGDRLRRSRADGLEKAVALLRQNEADLGPFFKTHEKGRNLLSYLAQLASHLAANEAGALAELESLVKNIQHIKDIVAVQQDSAKFSGLIEKFPVAELLEDALRMDAPSLERHHIQTVRRFDPHTPPVEADRHKVLQILVNVIRNAKQACDESGRSDKRIILGVYPAGKTVKITIADNGMGIVPENLERVFNHGFTTRKDGHGFGLHNAAVAAKEMGGSLSVTSPGAGHGATFTLELPFSRNGAALP